MNVEKDVYYVAEDKQRQRLSWVKSVGADGKETIYTSPKSPYKDKAPPAEQIRKMDCIDCHNRPTHQFQAPYRLMNDAMHRGLISPEIPEIKQKGMELLSQEYATHEEALAAIRTLPEYYQTKHADYFAGHEAEIRKAVEQLEESFAQNIFPEMKVRWDTHPDNIGHLVAPGCFRCHDGEHQSSDGRTITQDCKACHVIVEQGPPGSLEKDLNGLEFKHPTDDEWQGASCTDCHTGGA